MMVLSEPVRITLLLTEVFERLNVRYLVGGSLASSIHGIPRATQDADLVAEISPSQIKPLCQALRNDFYIDEDMIKEALWRESSFNIIYLATMFKIDIFLLRKDPHDQEKMSRREPYPLPDKQGSLYIASAEDMILEKLRWYRLGNQVSDRQWQDVQGILKVKRGQLDEAYLHKKSNEMGLEQLLQKAQQQAG